MCKHRWLITSDLSLYYLSLIILPSYMLRKVLAIQHSTHTFINQVVGIVDERNLTKRGGRCEQIDLNKLGGSVWLEQFRCRDNHTLWHLP